MHNLLRPKATVFAMIWYMRLRARNTKKIPIDARWFAELVALARDIPEPYFALVPSSTVLDGKRRAFEASGYLAEVDLRAVHLDERFYERHTRALYSLRYRLNAEESQRAICAAYSSVIDEAIAKNDLCLAAIHGDAQRFAAENYFVYGCPDEDVFRSAVEWLRTDTAATPAATGRLERLRDDVLRAIPALQGNTARFLPSKATYERVRNLHYAPGGYMEQLFGSEGLPHGGLVERQLGDAICRRVLRRIGSDYTLADSRDGVWGVDHLNRQVLRPPSYMLTPEGFAGIVCHEIGSHLLEVVNGSQQSLLLLKTGLSRYEHGNEGRALLREQIIHPGHTDFLTYAPWRYNVAKHVLVSLAVGHEGRPRTFAEVYAAAYALFAFWQERQQPGLAHADRAAHDKAWHLTVRLLKGTAGQGGAYTKDVVYLEGNIRCWRIARHHPEMILHGDLGKFDIANSQHIALLRQLDILHPRTATAKRRVREGMYHVRKLRVHSRHV